MAKNRGEKRREFSHLEEGKERVKIKGKKRTEKKLGGTTWATVMFVFPI